VTSRLRELSVAASLLATGGIAWWLALPAARTTEDRGAVERELLCPYVAAGTPTEGEARSLLAGRFSVLEAVAGQLVRATFDGDREQRIAVVGPGRVVVVSATAAGVQLEATGTLLADARSPARLVVTAGVVISAHHATFAVRTSCAGTTVFVDRGEVDIGTTHLRAGDWYGPPGGRTAPLVTLLRDHANAITPRAGDDARVLAVAEDAAPASPGGQGTRRRRAATTARTDTGLAREQCAQPRDPWRRHGLPRRRSRGARSP
jgi:hypothetical protein